MICTWFLAHSVNIGLAGVGPLHGRLVLLTTPLDFCVRGHLMSSVYETPIVSEEDLVAPILAAAEQLQHKYGVFQPLRDALSRRCVSRIEAGGRMFEQYL